MDNTLIQYSMYYRALKRFEDEFPQKLKPDSPSALSNVRYIHQVVEPDDQDFRDGRVDRVVQKVLLVLNLTNKVLISIHPFVRTGEHWWIRAKFHSLTAFGSIVQMSLMGLCFENGIDHDTQASSAGVGSLNLADIEEQRLVNQPVLGELNKLINVLS